MRKFVRRSSWVLPMGLILGLFVAGAGLMQMLSPPARVVGASAPVYLEVHRGESLRSLANRMADAGLVRNPWLFSMLGRVMRVDRDMKAGDYVFRPGTPALELLRLMQRGMSALDQVTVPEGRTAVEIARMLRAHAGVDTAAFLRLVRDPRLAEALGIHSASLEGYLFPETYTVLKGSRPEDIIRLMVAHGLRVYREEAADAASPAPYTSNEVMTMASIVEAEAMQAAERARIAAVYYNRLQQGMRLQADPTVVYALGGRRSRVYLRDLEVDSPYNTYRNPGLPPGPICNPGRASIHAALNPMKGESALFFVARGDGRHEFSTTFQQHSSAIRQVRGAGRAAQGPPESGAAAPRGADHP